jgi:ABC-type multidrug transport system fused ATPase/permease subunit
MKNILNIPKSLHYERDLKKIKELLDNNLKQGNQNLLSVFWEAFKYEFFLLVFPGLISNLFLFSSSILIYFFLTGLKSADYSSEYLLLLAISIGLVIQLSFFLKNHSILKAFLLISKIKGILIELAYQKILKLDLSELKGASQTGKIINLINSDVENFGGLQNLPNLISIPFILIGCIAFLSKALGIAGLLGVLTIVLHLPLSYLLMKCISEKNRKTFLASDERLNLLNDLLDGIKVIKFYGWESLYLNKVLESRVSELSLIKYKTFLNILCNTINAGSIGMILLITFSTYSALGNEFEPAKIFGSITALIVCNGIITSTGVQGILSCFTIKIAFERFSSLISATEKSECFVGSSNSHSIEVEKGSFFFNYEGCDSLDETCLNPNFIKFKLSQINFTLSKGELLVITGDVASGKSSLLLALLQELAYKEGTVNINGTISYTSQHPWLIEGSFRKNILMGKEFNPKLYKKVIRVCALEKDLAGESTICDTINVGNKGNNISGGQMARVALSRALYANTDIYLLDDPFSAIDLGLQNQMFKTCIEYMLKKKSVIVATNKPSFLRKADKILLLDHGTQIFFGDLKDFLIATDCGIPRTLKFEKRQFIQQLSRRPSILFQSFCDSEFDTEEENLHNNLNSRKVLKKYLIFGFKNWAGIFLMFLVLSIAQVSSFSLVWYFKIWINSSNSGNLPIFALLVVSFYVFLFVRSVSIHFPLISSSKNIHNLSIKRFIFSSLSQIDKIGISQIQNRFSKDLNITDQEIRNEFEEFLITSSNFCATLIFSIIISPFQLITSILVIAYIAFLLKFSIQVLKDLRKVDINTRPQIVSSIDNSIFGLASIHCFQLQDFFTKEIKSKVLKNMSAYLTSKLMYLSLFNYLYIGPNIVNLVTMVFFVLYRDSIDAETAAIGISYSISMLAVITSLFKKLVEFDCSLVSVSRLLELQDSIPEDVSGVPFDIKNGNIEFENVYLKYNSRAEYTFKDFDLSFKALSKTGILGRSGAGKSTIFNMILRTVSPSAGRVLIDGVDILNIELDSLRRQIIAIPQEPVLFGASIRFNLDPHSKFNDEELKKLLIEFKLDELLCGVDYDLDKNLAEVDLNLSIGQKQLFSVARACVNKGKVLVVDEATANIDRALERFVNLKIRSCFDDNTVIIISHKLTSVVFCDSAVFLQDGNVKEEGKIEKLIQNPRSKFNKMIALLDDEESEEFFECLKLRKSSGLGL